MVMCLLTCPGAEVNLYIFVQMMMKVPILTTLRPVASGGAGGARAPPLFVRSVNPISTRGGTLSPPSTMCPPGFSDLATALDDYFLSFVFTKDFLHMGTSHKLHRIFRGSPKDELLLLKT